MRTFLLILVWIMMGIKLMSGWQDIKDLQSYITIYAMLSIYLGVIAWQYKKRNRGEIL